MISSLEPNETASTSHSSTANPLPAREGAQKEPVERRSHETQKAEALSTLLGGIAHDFNNILGAIMAFTELARLDCEQNQSALESLDEVLTATGRAKDLIGQILAFSRKQPRASAPLQLVSFLKEATRLLRAGLPASIKLAFDFEPDIPMIQADPCEIQALVTSLCTEAAESIGTRQGTITMSLQRSSDGVTLRLSHHLAATNPLGRDGFKLSGTSADRDLRLIDIRSLAALNGATLERSNLPEGGPQYEIHFPTLSPVTPEKTEGAAKPRGQGQRILVVDDDEALARVLTKLLHQLGYEAAAETDPTRALERIQRAPESVDLLLSDISMPDAIGVDLAVAARQARPRLPVLVCTGYSDQCDRAELRALGIHDVLYKPVSSPTLATAIASALQAAAAPTTSIL